MVVRSIPINRKYMKVFLLVGVLFFANQLFSQKQQMVSMNVSKPLTEYINERLDDYKELFIEIANRIEKTTKSNIENAEELSKLMIEKNYSNLSIYCFIIASFLIAFLGLVMSAKTNIAGTRKEVEILSKNVDRLLDKMLEA